MKHHKILWYEGMTLDPHHFQQWDHYHQAVLNARVRTITSFHWGFSDLEIDSDSLVNGQFNLLRCKGVTQDGLLFDIPDTDSLPGSRNIAEHFPAAEEKVEVFLTVPVEKQGGKIFQTERSKGEIETRYYADKALFTDENTGTNERTISVAKTNYRIRFGNEPLQDSETLKIAEILRSSESSFSMNDSYIPPLLSIEGSGKMMTITRRVLELLVAKSSSLWERRQQHPSGQIEFTTSDVTVFWLLHTVNSFIPLLNHHYTIGKIHPESLYLLLLSLAGQLTTFASNVKVFPRDFPPYDHNNLYYCFNQVETIIRELTGEAVSTNVVSIPLQKKRESLYVGLIGDDSLFQEAQFYLVISGDLPGDIPVNDLPKKLRVASPETIDSVLKSLTLALTVTHQVRPPMGLPLRSGYEYLRLEKQGPYWESICQSRAFAIFVPSELVGLPLELVALRQSSF